MPSDRDTLTYRLRQFGLERDRLWTVLARSSGIGATDLVALEQLDVHGAMSQSQLGRSLGLTSGAVTMLVDRLQRAGWLERYPHHSDRRSLVVDLAPGAAEAMPAGLTDYDRSMQVLARTVPVGQRGVLIEFLQNAAVATAAVAHDYS